MSRHTANTIDPKQEINDLMNSIDALRTVYVKENEALESSNAKAFLGLQDEKITAANIYKARIESIMMSRDTIKQTDPLLPKTLKTIQAEFAELTEKNLLGLKRMQRCGERLAGKLRLAAKETAQRKGVFSYGNSGSITHNRKVVVSTGVSETA